MLLYGCFSVYVYEPHSSGIMQSSFSLLIVVPTLNSFHCLGRLTSSLQSQTFKDWRLLFVDGCSRPDHKLWLEKFCASEVRSSWCEQLSSHPGIFGAMNHGFDSAGPNDWLLFWGSDDWAAAPSVLVDLSACLNTSLSQGITPDLLVCSGRYADARTGRLGRSTSFISDGLLGSVAYRRALLFGSTPPHQATLIGPGARQRLASYATGFRLSADLDYFLQLSLYPDICVQCIDLELVHMADGGVSAQQTKRRLVEVRRAYRRTFSWIWWFPFLMRYTRRLASLIFQKR